MNAIWGVRRRAWHLAAMGVLLVVIGRMAYADYYYERFANLIIGCQASNELFLRQHKGRIADLGLIHAPPGTLSSAYSKVSPFGLPFFTLRRGIVFDDVPHSIDFKQIRSSFGHQIAARSNKNSIFPG
jgi:hypothetical protein